MSPALTEYTFLKKDWLGFNNPLVPNSSFDPKYDFKFDLETELFEQKATLKGSFP